MEHVDVAAARGSGGRVGGAKDVRHREAVAHVFLVAGQREERQLDVLHQRRFRRLLGKVAHGGEGVEPEREFDGGEGGELAVAEKPWAPKDTEELLDAIATQDYGVSDDRSSKLAVPAIKAYNKVADGYHQTLQKRGQPLHEGFVIVKAPAGLAPVLAHTMHFVDALTRMHLVSICLLYTSPSPRD